ncbi:hypothetical protein KM043_003421 [Ampulex compressa]|nr:hypothetical protein KM043_003421 [Ampulex compressa]
MWLSSCRSSNEVTIELRKLKRRGYRVKETRRKWLCSYRNWKNVAIKLQKLERSNYELPIVVELQRLEQSSNAAAYSHGDTKTLTKWLSSYRNSNEVVMEILHPPHPRYPKSSSKTRVLRTSPNRIFIPNSRALAQLCNPRLLPAIVYSLPQVPGPGTQASINLPEKERRQCGRTGQNSKRQNSGGASPLKKLPPCGGPPGGARTEDKRKSPPNPRTIGFPISTAHLPSGPPRGPTAERRI